MFQSMIGYAVKHCKYYRDIYLQENEKETETVNSNCRSYLCLTSRSLRNDIMI